MNDIDYDKLSSMVADKVSSQIAEKLIQKTTKEDVTNFVSCLI